LRYDVPVDFHWGGSMGCGDGNRAGAVVVRPFSGPSGIALSAASTSAPGTSDNVRGFAGGSRGRSRLLYQLLPLQVLRGPLAQVRRKALCFSAIASDRSYLLSLSRLKIPT